MSDPDTPPASPESAPSGEPTLNDLARRVVAFRDEREWAQFHNPKDAALSLMLEVAELLEHMQWKNGAELAEALRQQQAAVGEELADVLYWVLLLSHDLGIDLAEAFVKKLAANAKKYPVEKARGVSRKYSDL